MINSTEKEKNLGIFHQMQTAIMLAKMTKTETQTNTALKILPPAIMNLIGVYLLMPGKLDRLLALAIFLQQDSALNTPEVKQINRTLNEAISTNNFTSEYVDPIYNTTFTRIIELIGNRKEELLREAAKAGNELAVVQLLKIDGIDVNAKDNNGWTALMRAADKGHTSIITALLNVDGILVNAKGNHGWTALMLAGGKGHTSIITALLNVDGILVNAKDNDGWTALMWTAYHHGRTSIVHQLCLKQLFDAPYGQGDELFQQLNNEIESLIDSMTINPASLCANFLVSISALPAPDVKIALLEKALSGSNAFSALMQNDQRLQIEQALTKLNPPQEAQSTNSTQPVIFSAAPVASGSESNTANTSPRLISNQSGVPT